MTTDLQVADLRRQLPTPMLIESGVRQGALYQKPRQGVGE